MSENRSKSNSFTDGSGRTEAALRAQLIELRRELSNSQQEVEQTKLDLQQRQELLRSAAGEARKEVLTLRKHKEDSQRQLSEASERIKTLEAEIEQLSNEPPGIESGSSLHLRDDLSRMEQELEASRGNERVSAASREALNLQIGELVEKLTELQAELKSSQESRAALQKEADRLDRELKDQKRVTEELHYQLKMVSQDKEQLAGRAELLENELEVMGQEGTEDRLSSAAQMLQLTQECQELRERFQTSAESDMQVDKSPARASPQHLVLNGDSESGGLSDTHFSPESRQQPPFPHSDSVSVTSIPSPQKRLLNELLDASKYLETLNARLDWESGGEAREALEAELRTSQPAKDAVSSFSSALNALQNSLGQKKLQELLGSQQLVQIHANGSHHPSQPIQSQSQQRKRSLGNGLIGGLVVIPAIAAVIAFLPRRR